MKEPMSKPKKPAINDVRRVATRTRSAGIGASKVAVPSITSPICVRFALLRATVEAPAPAKAAAAMVPRRLASLSGPVAGRSSTMGAAAKASRKALQEEKRLSGFFSSAFITASAAETGSSGRQ